ncbi:hypothetical protein C7H19_08370 [Aphanothece hegewaldii CCALA 016]|uniref:Uncharacterized protein n=1 Tax=Aphanothece hegewaldii CCALA 016 TaxID=2107694 RepID=A0A2T1LZY3_9CHRO|nr:hypothetical protein [Aphanothece hegewaldii]PSF37976.1 hypothetical protein C7H19_08370 [Aphanothece hegewaldii CCALA 016]
MTETNHRSIDNFLESLEPTSPVVEIFDVDIESTKTDWFAVAQSLRQQNQNLNKTIVQLEQSLCDAQQNLQIQTRRVRSAQMLINQQTEELNQTPEKIAQLKSELESNQQTIQQQQNVINHLSAQLEKTQEQLAYLERECALLQEEKTGKTHQLLTAEKHMQELQSRLLRQQRYTLQYKSALEKISENETNLSTKVIPLLPKNSSIQPWTNVKNELETPKQESMNAWIERAPDEQNAITSDGNYAIVESNQRHSLEDELLVELEDNEPVSKPQKIPNNSKNLSFSIISSNSNWKKPSSKSVDLPTFLREQSS